MILIITSMLLIGLTLFNTLLIAGLFKEVKDKNQATIDWIKTCYRLQARDVLELLKLMNERPAQALQIADELNKVKIKNKLKKYENDLNAQ